MPAAALDYLIEYLPDLIVDCKEVKLREKRWVSDIDVYRSRRLKNFPALGF